MRVGSFSYGHSAGINTIGIGAVDVAECASGSGKCFNKTLSSEIFSSDGPRTTFFGLDGVTPLVANLAGPGITINNPKFAGTDGMATSVSGFSVFFGTSSATPAVGALLALLLSIAPGISYGDAITLLGASTIPVNSSAQAGAGVPWLQPVFAAIEACYGLGGHYIQANNTACLACPPNQNGTVGLATCHDAPTTPPPTTTIPTTTAPTTSSPTTRPPRTQPPTQSQRSGATHYGRVLWLQIAIFTLLVNCM